jgi:hypothetical protein
VLHANLEDYAIDGWEMIMMTNKNGGFYFSEEFGFEPKTKKSPDKKKGDKKHGKKESSKKDKQKN